MPKLPPEAHDSTRIGVQSKREVVFVATGGTDPFEKGAAPFVFASVVEGNGEAKGTLVLVHREASNVLGVEPPPARPGSLPLLQHRRRSGDEGLAAHTLLESVHAGDDEQERAHEPS